MPLQADVGAGGPATTAGRAMLRQTLVIAAGGPVTLSRDIEVIGLPNLQFWIRQTVGAGTAVTCQFAASSMTGVIVTAEFLPLGAPVVLPAGPTTPLLLNFTVSCRFARIEVAPPAAGCTLDILILAAS